MDRKPNWFIGAPVNCAVCDKCHWDLRTIPEGGTAPTACLYGGPFAGYAEAAPADAAVNASRYWK